MNNHNKKPYTTEDFFYAITALLATDNEIPDILEYSLASRKPISITDCEFDVKMDVHFGGNEGIYLSIYLEGNFGDPTNRRAEIGSFKTLLESKVAFQKMALLGANFICAARDFIEKDMEAFIWNGYKLSAFNKDGKSIIGYYITDKDRALERKAEFVNNYPDCKIVLLDMENRKEV